MQRRFFIKSLTKFYRDKVLKDFKKVSILFLLSVLFSGCATVTGHSLGKKTFDYNIPPQVKLEGGNFQTQIFFVLDIKDTEIDNINNFVEEELMLRKNIIFSIALFFYFCFFTLPAIPAEPDNGFEEVGTAGTSGENKLALLQFSLTSTSGNTETTSIFTGTELFYGSGGDSIGFDGNLYYGEHSRTLTVRTSEGRLKGGHDFNPNNYAYLLGTLKHDEFQRLNIRSSLGIGYGYRLLQDSYEELSLEAGVGLQGEDFNGNRKDDYYHEGRIGINYTYKFSKTARFVTKDEYLPSFSGISNYRVRGEFKLVESLYKNLVVILNLILDYDDSPIESDVKNLDTRIFAGVGYNFF